MQTTWVRPCAPPPPPPPSLIHMIGLCGAGCMGQSRSVCVDHREDMKVSVWTTVRTCRCLCVATGHGADYLVLWGGALTRWRRCSRRSHVISMWRLLTHPGSSRVKRPTCTTGARMLPRAAPVPSCCWWWWWWWWRWALGCLWSDAMWGGGIGLIRSVHGLSEKCIIPEKSTLQDSTEALE